MKKLLTVFLILSMLLISTSCEKKNETTNTKNETTEKSSAKSAKANEPFLISTDKGDYKLTFEKVRTTDKRSEDFKKEFKKVLFLDYTYENVSFGDDDTHLLIADDAFEVKDDKGNILEMYPSYDEKRPSQLIPKGKKCIATSTYALNSDSKNLTVSFVRENGEKICTTTLPIE